MISDREQVQRECKQKKINWLSLQTAVFFVFIFLKSPFQTRKESLL